MSLQRQQRRKTLKAGEDRRGEGRREQGLGAHGRPSQVLEPMPTHTHRWLVIRGGAPGP